MQWRGWMKLTLAERKCQDFYSTISLVLYTPKGRSVNWAFKKTILTLECCVILLRLWWPCNTQVLTVCCGLSSIGISMIFEVIMSKYEHSVSLEQLLVFNILWIVLVQKARTKTRNSAIVCSVHRRKEWRTM